jgi:hypothetical protein
MDIHFPIALSSRLLLQIRLAAGAAGSEMPFFGCAFWSCCEHRPQASADVHVREVVLVVAGKVCDPTSTLLSLLMVAALTLLTNL